MSSQTSIQKALEQLSPSDLDWVNRATAHLLFLEQKEAAEVSLAEFIRQAWHVLEPGQPYIHGWHIDAMCAHLEAVTDGRLTEDGSSPRLLINIIPGAMKSLLVTVLWPAWEWGPRNMPHLRYLGVSHEATLAAKHSTMMRRLVTSDWYRERWGDRVQLTADQNEKVNFENTSGGFRMAVSSSSITGRRADRVLVDDPHSVDGAASDALRQTVVDNFLEAIPLRLSNPISSAIVVIMQRLHEDDVSGVILSKGLGYVHLMLPMEFDPGRCCQTDVLWVPPGHVDLVPFCDPRDDEGELLFPARFPHTVVERDKAVMGPYAVAGQFQQMPEPRGGGIFQRVWWQPWEPADDKFPVCDYILASLDSAFTEKESNDPSGFIVVGVFRDAKTNHPQVILLHAWRKHLQMHGPHVARLPNETNDQYRLRCRPSWGLVEWVADSCRRFKVDKLIIEAKASGITAAQEMNRLYGHETWTTQTENVKGDKVARALAVVPIFSQAMVWHPVRNWAEMVIAEMEVFPRGRYKDLTDAMTQAVKHLRDLGLLQRSDEIQADENEAAQYRPHRQTVSESYFA